MTLHIFPYKDLAINAYLIVDEDTQTCVAVDPPRTVQAMVDFIQMHQLSLNAVLETHVHADFISGALELKNTFNDMPQIYCSSEGGTEWLPTYAEHPVKEGDQIKLGHTLIKALHTPGHTPEHLTWVVYDANNECRPLYALTGDFLFVQGVGRPDLLGNTLREHLFKELYTSVFKRIAVLPDSVTIYPAHGAGSFCGKSMSTKPFSTLGEERQTSEVFAALNFEEWVNLMGKEMPTPPPSFKRNKKLNLIGVPLLETLPADQDSAYADIDLDMDQMSVIDFRDPLAFAEKHWKYAINVPFSPGMGNWLAAVITPGKSIVCLLSEQSQRLKIRELIRLIGYDQPLIFMPADAAVNEQHKDLVYTHLSIMDVQQLKERLDCPQRVYVVDVRTPAEWHAGHIQEAHHIELNAFNEKLSHIPTDKEVIVICGSGWRSSIAASLLQAHGHSHVAHVRGGMSEWRKRGFACAT